MSISAQAKTNATITADHHTQDGTLGFLVQLGGTSAFITAEAADALGRYLLAATPEPVVEATRPTEPDPNIVVRVTTCKTCGQPIRTALTQNRAAIASEASRPPTSVRLPMFAVSRAKPGSILFHDRASANLSPPARTGIPQRLAAMRGRRHCS